MIDMAAMRCSSAYAPSPVDRLPSPRYHAYPDLIQHTLMQQGTLLAAIDLGSNSFRLEIGRYEFGHIQRVGYYKDLVRQGGDLDENKNLSREAMERGWACLARFAERLKGFPATQVRAVATQTLREARNRDEFLQKGSQILGYPIDVVSGPEEARLIYQGVSRLLAQSNERRLVMDIGGRSTELILGQEFTAHSVASFHVGSVAWSQRYFAQGTLTEASLSMAYVAAKAVFDEAMDTFSPDTWDAAYASSGTANAVGDILAASGFTPGLIRREDLDWLHEKMLSAQTLDRLRLDGLKDERRPVIAGGICVMRALFDLLEIKYLQVAQGALRQGALYDLLERDHAGVDLRSNTVSGLMRRFGVDIPQAERVARTASTLFTQTAPANSERAERELDWAARLHEIGCLISHSDAHRHGAYILDHTDAAGFSGAELHQLALLIQGQRGKVHKLGAAVDERFFALQLLSLRLALVLCHARRDPASEGLRLQVNHAGFGIQARSDWAHAHPQSVHLLREEVQAWQKTRWDIALNTDA